jgi:erythromycin esterase-like protein
MELITFLEWLREFNAMIFPDRVLVRGYDIQLPWLELNLLSALNEPPESYSGFMASHNLHFPPDFTPEHVKAFQTKVQDGEVTIGMQTLIDLRNDINKFSIQPPPCLQAYSQDFSPRALLRKLLGWLEMLSVWQSDVPLSIQARDAAMADDILWAVRHFRKKAVIIAHNGHLVYDPAALLPKTDNQGHGDLMGSHLRREFEDQYHCIMAIGHDLTVWDIPVKETRKIVFDKGLEGCLLSENASIRFVKPHDLRRGTAIIGSPTKWSDPEDEFDHMMEADWTRQTSLFFCSSW